MTYEILNNGHSIKCLKCNLTSHHPDDVKELYCGNCKHFHGDIRWEGTGTCFDDALDFLCDKIKEKPQRLHSKTWKLVHGICLHRDGRPYSHAWVHEGSRHVWFSGILRGYKSYGKATREEFFAEFRVQEFTEYTAKEAISENWKYGHFGPWIDKYIRLTKGYNAEKGGR